MWFVVRHFSFSFLSVVFMSRWFVFLGRAEALFRAWSASSRSFQEQLRLLGFLLLARCRCPSPAAVYRRREKIVLTTGISSYSTSIGWPFGAAVLHEGTLGAIQLIVLLLITRLWLDGPLRPLLDRRNMQGGFVYSNTLIVVLCRASNTRWPDFLRLQSGSFYRVVPLCGLETWGTTLELR